ncbi:MAG: hypothetical protein IJR07_07810 [Bacteroidaceae bacterium]|nr:hypothetical protein [Bacteroidaceae bacterium]
METTVRRKTTIKRTREELRAAFKDALKRKKAYQREALARLESMSEQGFFEPTTPSIP